MVADVSRGHDVTATAVAGDGEGGRKGGEGGGDFDSEAGGRSRRVCLDGVQ